MPGQSSLRADTAGDQNGDSLFIPAANEDDDRWQPIDENEGQAETIGWDTSADHVSHQRLLSGEAC